MFGTTKFVEFVAAVKRWAREKALPELKRRIEEAVKRGAEGAVRPEV